MNTNKKFDYVVFIGRFQPLHIGHAEVIRKAFEIADNVLIFVGSAKQPRTHKNPWIFEERREMIESFILREFDKWGLNGGKYFINPLRDVKYNNQLWAAQVTQIVDDIIRVSYTGNSKPKIAIIGHSKDETSFYLKMFPQWKEIEHPMNEDISATTIRQMYLEGMSHKFLEAAIPSNVTEFLENFPQRMPQEFAAVKSNYSFCKAYRKGWSVAPYPVKHVTTDAVVVQSGHILLVTRKSEPGEGLIALPGGHLKEDETIVDGMIRELREETKLKVPEKVLRGSIKESEVFDAPDRSLIGRVITHAFYIELEPGELPVVRGSDDAKHAKWYPISDIDDEIGEERFFDDHYHIINKMLGKT